MHDPGIQHIIYDIHTKLKLSKGQFGIHQELHILQDLVQILSMTVYSPLSIFKIFYNAIQLPLFY